MNKHTPGPWRWVHHETLIGADGSEVCDDGSANGEYAQILDPDGPDGRLIAAAPTLLAACDYALRQFIDLRDHPEPELIIDNRIDEIIDFLSGTLSDLESGDL